MDEQFDPKKIVYIHLGKSDKTDDSEILAWLAEIINKMNDSYILSDGAIGELTDLQELEYLDNTVTGDEHPDALDMIMSSYNKFKVK